MSRLAGSGAPGMRVGLALSAATTGLILVAAAIHQAFPGWSFGLASGVLLAWVAAEVAIKRDSPGAASSAVLPESQDNYSAQGVHRAPTECTAGRAECWPASALQTLLQAAEDMAPQQEASGVANSLARRACELVNADAAWVYRIEENGERVALASSHVRPAVVQRAGVEGETARRLAKEIALADHPDAAWEGRATRVFADGDYVVVPLVCQRRVHSVLAVRGVCAGSIPFSLQEKLLSSLASHAEVSLENALLQQTLRDLLAKLRQLEVHRAGYVATVSHELRTPLTSIKGFAQLLMRADAVPPSLAQSYAGTIAAEAEKLTRIVDDIIALTRMETGLLKLRRKPISLSRVVKRVVQNLVPSGASRRLEVALPERLPPVRGDAGRLDQLLGSLVADAISRSHPGSAILLGGEARGDGVTIWLQYRTTRDRIEELTRALEGPGHCSSNGQATQLGQGSLVLYICKNFIEAHGGTLWVDCPEEEAVRTAFTLPY